MKYTTIKSPKGVNREFGYVVRDGGLIILRCLGDITDHADMVESVKQLGISLGLNRATVTI